MSLDQHTYDVQGELAKIWQDLLGHRDFGPDDAFYRVGGHSILAIKLRAAILNRMGRAVPLADLVRARSLAAMATMLEVGTKPAPEEEVRPSETSARSFPISIYQEPLLLASLLACRRGGSDPYVFVSGMVIEGPLDRSRLKASVEAVIARHGVFYTRFSESDGWLQVIEDQVQCEWVWTESATPEESCQAEIRGLVERNFDLTTGPLLRIAFFPSTTGRNYLVFQAHHLITDEWSLGLIADEISVAYRSGPEALEPAPPRDAYGRIAEMQRRRFESGGLADDLSYWRKLLAGEAQIRPIARRRGEPSGQLARVTAAIEGRVLEALERRAEAANATVSAAAMAAFALAAARTAGVAELRIQCPMTVRDDDFEQRVAGYFLNSCTLRLQVSPDQPVEQLLDAVSCRLAEALAHKDLPYAQILDAHPALSEPGFHHARFAFVSSADAPMALEGCEISELPSARRAAKFDLQVTAERRPARLAFHIEFDPAVYAHEEIAAFAAIISAAAHDLAFGRTEAAGLEPTDASPGDVREALRRSLSARLPENARQARNAPNAQALPPPIRPTPELAGAGLVVAGAEGTDLSEYLAGRRDWATSALLRLGAVLFRGFDELSVESFADLLDKISLGTLDYENRSTPRTRLLNNIFTSTEYPANESIPLHNENAYSAHWPDLLAFLCRRPAQSGGATPICDSREVYRRISPPTREKFEALGVTYTRRFGCVGLSWQETFQTDRREAVDAYCAANNIERAWNSDGDLDTRQTLPAVRTHPVTGEKVWFNQAHLFHVTSLGPATAAAMIELYGVDQLPRHALFGDGSAIPDEMLDEIRAAYAAAEVPVQWRVGDLLLLDNMLFAHGRQPYRGEREIVVGMARLYG